MKKLFILICFLMLCTSQAYAVDLTGNWYLNANGWKFLTKITQLGNTVSGTMTDINYPNPGTTNISGTLTLISYDVYKIEFDRTLADGTTIFQHYVGYLYNGTEAEKGMAGTFQPTRTNTDGIWGWYAEKY